MQLVVAQRRLGPKSFLAANLIIGTLMILSVDMYIPALPGMMREFGVSAAYLNLTLFMFFLVQAISIVIIGPMSDRFGRRPLIIASSVCFLAGSVGCAFAPSVGVLVLWRMMQAVGLGGVTALGTAIVKDAYAGSDLQLAMTLLQSLIIAGPVAAPFLGSFLLMVGTWRHVFWALAAFGVICLALSLLIDETLPAESRLKGGVVQSLKGTVATSRILLGSRRFTSLATLMSVAGLPYAAYLAVASYVLIDFFGASYLFYSVMYAIVCGVSVLAPFVYMLLSRKLAMRGLLVTSIILFAVSFVALALLGTVGPVIFTLAVLPFILAEGIVRPMAYVELLDQPAERVGAASSFSNFAYSVLFSVGTALATLGWPSFIFGLVVLVGASTVAMAILMAIWRRS